MLKILSWNIARRAEPWRCLANCDADVALLQEAADPPADIAGRFQVHPASCLTAGAGLNRRWRAAVVKLSDRVELECIPAKPIKDACPGELGVSREGTLAAAVLRAIGCEPLILASVYAPWEWPQGTKRMYWMYADASVHRIISDLSVFIRSRQHRILIAGDLNSLYGYGEDGDAYWAARHATVFNRMSALGFSFLGPQVPNGRCADPWPNELPQSSQNVPTFHTNRQNPHTATRQLDFVFASNSFAEQVRVCALNEPCDWGPSDHCRLEISVGP